MSAKSKIRRLLDTTAFRSALSYACVFSLLTGLGMGFVYWSTKSHIEGQVDARLRLETEVLLKLYRNQAMPALLDTIQRRSDDNLPAIFFYLLQSPNRSWLAGRPPDWMGAFDAQSSYATLRLGDVFQFVSPEHNDWVRVLVTSLPGGYQLVVGRDLNEEKRLLEHTLTMIILVVAVIFIIALATSAAMGHRALKRIDAINTAAGAIMRGDWAQRLPISARDNEFDQLSRNLNEMLERIEQLMQAMRQVTDNVAHDLRKPLNRLRSRLEVTLLEARTEEEYRAVMAQGIDDADELLKTFNALLNIAQAEAGVRRNDWAEVSIAPLVEDLADLYGAVAEEKDIAFSWSSDADITIPGNRQLLAQAIGNLLDNAVKYTPPGGTIELRVWRRQPITEIIVADSGPGIANADKARVLRRFVRLDNSRSLPGNGLGLSLVSAVAKLHDASLLLEDNHPGLRVILRFAAAGSLQRG